MENGEATVLISFDSRLDANAELKASLSAEIQQALEHDRCVGTLVFHSELTENAEVAKIAEEFHVSLGRATGSSPQQIKPGCPRTRLPACRWTSFLNSKRLRHFFCLRIEVHLLGGSKKIALKDAKLDELTQKIVFTREELSRNQGKPCYLLEFYTGRINISTKSTQRAAALFTPGNISRFPKRKNRPG